ncbi:glucose-6-phosphate isomerase [Natronorarus salvus]|uniref:glucose-6-phosphate isomerase n=1 Tax=Natronorarus salvus TaxID=3117733 RepID=UPI002F263B55
MKVDIGNALAAEATPGVPRDALDGLDERVATAHERIERGIEEREHGYAALALPGTVDTDEIRAAVAPLSECETLVTVGIGGSALGAATLCDALSPEFDSVVLDNVDPDHTRRVLSTLDLERTAMHVVSRSGTTAETLATFLVLREAFERADVDWAERTLVTTGSEGNLRALADRRDLPVLDVPAGVPGRFSALSSVALPAAAMAGADLDALLAGAREEFETLSDSLFSCPAYAYGATSYALALRGWRVNAMCPYAESLETFSEWFAQLWAESLGKDGLGQLPSRAVGATDQHSQLQYWRAGPRDAMVTLVRPSEREPCPIPETELEGIGYLGGTDLGTVLEAEFEATEASLATAGRPNVRVEVDRIDERGLGELLYGMEAACVLAGELFGVETFTQPAVEWGKRAARGLLGDEGSTEAARVGEKTRLVVE